MSVSVLLTSQLHVERTVAVGVDLVAPRVLERAREAHSVEDGDASGECAVDGFCVIIDVYVG